MAVRGRVPEWVRRTGIEVTGWILVVLGTAALVLPGPGLLMLAAGLTVLSQQYPWAHHFLGPMRANAHYAAALGVRTVPRIAVSCAGALGIMGVGAVWILQPVVPAWWFLAERWWLFGGVATGISLIASSIIALALIAYSVRRFRGRPLPARPIVRGRKPR